MECLAILQARLSSKRLPGKVLTKINGKPLIAYQIERILRSKRISGLVVATSTEESDRALVEYCKSNSIAVEAGPLDQVASRFRGVIKKYKPSSFVRICGDSPWYDPHLLDQGIELFQSGDYEIVCNILPRTFPKGVSIEIFSSSTFEREFPELSKKYDMESFTTYFYDAKERFKIGTFKADKDYSMNNLCVDTAQDLERFSKAITSASKPPADYSWKEALSFI